MKEKCAFAGQLAAMKIAVKDGSDYTPAPSCMFSCLQNFLGVKWNSFSILLLTLAQNGFFAEMADSPNRLNEVNANETQSSL